MTKSRKLFVASSIALVLTLAGSAVAAYAWSSTRVTRWGDLLVVGPRFTGDAVLDGGATRIGVLRDPDGTPALDVPPSASRGPVTVTFWGGFAIYRCL
jgi:hypothetical protein